MLPAHRVLYRYLDAARKLDLKTEGLEGLTNGTPVTLYHGTTKSFKTFDMAKSRRELVDNYYGGGIFLTPSKRVAWKYARANRNIGFEPEIIEDLKRINHPAGEFLRVLYAKGTDGWESFMREQGFFDDNPPPDVGQVDFVGFEKYLGVDPNTIGDLAGYVIGSKTKPLGMGEDEGALSLFSQSTGMPDHVYGLLDELGLDSTVYRPKVYTVVVTASKTLVTPSKAQARSARSKGYECVVYYGSSLVDGEPEVAIFDSSHARITNVEVDD